MKLLEAGPKAMAAYLEALNQICLIGYLMDVLFQTKRLVIDL